MDSGRNSRMSPGWQPSAPQIASRVEKRMARALPFLRIERLASVMSMRSASSVRVFRRSWSSSSSLTAMAMSHRPFEVFTHQRAFGEDAREDEGQNDRQPAAGRKAGIEMKRMSGRRNGFADKPDDEAERLLSEQNPGDRLQAVCICSDEGIALANRLHHRHQPLEQGEIQRDGNESERCNRAHAHDQRRGSRRGGEGES